MAEWLALDVGGTKVRQAFVREDGSVRDVRDYGKGAPGDVLRVRDQVIAGWPRVSSRPLGLSIAIAAMVDRSGTVLAAPNLPAWIGHNLVELFAPALGRPVHVVFDGTAALLGELWLGHPEVDNGFAISIGTGIGGGLVVDGRVLHGAHGLSGMPTSALVGEPEGLEAVASGPAVAAAAGAASGREVVQRGRTGDPRALNALARASAALYEAVAAVTATADVVSVIVAGGFGLAAFDLLFPEPRLPPAYRRYRLVHDDVMISPAVTGENATLLGAARHAFLEEATSR